MRRRSFLALLGTGPLAVKATADAELAKVAGAFHSNGMGGSASLGLSGGVGGPAPLPEAYVPYEKRIASAANYIKTFGIPEVIEYELRDRARCVDSLDHDIACKASWSMSVKLMTQRQRNYERELTRIEKSGWQHRSRQTLKTFLGVEWPW